MGHTNVKQVDTDCTYMYLDINIVKIVHLPTHSFLRHLAILGSPRVTEVLLHKLNCAD